MLNNTPPSKHVVTAHLAGVSEMTYIYAALALAEAHLQHNVPLILQSHALMHEVVGESNMGLAERTRLTSTIERALQAATAVHRAREGEATS